MQYIRFAREEPELYRMLFFSKPQKAGDGAIAEMERSKELMRDSLMEIYRIDAREADLYFRNLWLVAHSIATLIVTDSCPCSDEEIAGILTGYSAAPCKAIKEIPGFVAGKIDRDAVFGKLVTE